MKQGIIEKWVLKVKMLPAKNLTLAAGISRAIMLWSSALYVFIVYKMYGEISLLKAAVGCLSIVLLENFLFAKWVGIARPESE